MFIGNSVEVSWMPLTSTISPTTLIHSLPTLLRPPRNLVVIYVSSCARKETFTRLSEDSKEILRSLIDVWEVRNLLLRETSQPCSTPIRDMGRRDALGRRQENIVITSTSLSFRERGTRKRALSSLKSISPLPHYPHLFLVRSGRHSSLS